MEERHRLRDALADVEDRVQSERRAKEILQKMCNDMEVRAEKAERERDELFRILNDVCQDVRAKSADEYVCGLCEYDGAYIGESGDWVNECPGFEKDDCFCMKKSIREKFSQKEE